MATTPISSTPSNNKIDNQRAANRAVERRSPKAAERFSLVQEKREERQRAKAARDEDAVRVLTRKAATSKPSNEPSQEPQAASAPPPEPKKIEKRSESKIAGARIINIAVRGTRSGSELSFFAPGEGPGAKRVEEPKKKEAVKEEEPKTIDTQA